MLAIVVMHLLGTIILKRCITLDYTRLLYWRDASHNTLDYCIGGCISQTRLLYWTNASHNTLDYCIGGMHLTIH